MWQRPGSGMGGRVRHRCWVGTVGWRATPCWWEQGTLSTTTGQARAEGGEFLGVSLNSLQYNLCCGIVLCCTSRPMVSTFKEGGTVGEIAASIKGNPILDFLPPKGSLVRNVTTQETMTIPLTKIITLQLRTRSFLEKHRGAAEAKSPSVVHRISGAALAYRKKIINW